MSVRIALVAPDPLILAGLSLVAIALLSAFTAPMERSFDADVFKRRKAFEGREADEEMSEESADSTYESLFDARGEETDEEKAHREAEAERIRRILRGEDK